MNRYLDHAVLKPEMTFSKAREAIQSGIDHKVKTVCVRPCDLELAVSMCEGTETQVCVVLGFPHGTGLSAVKALEAELYANQGAHEIDMVINYGQVRSGLWDFVESDVRAVSDVTRARGLVLKVILETAVLTPAEILTATELCAASGADYVKTSTGFNGGGATEEAINLMLKASRGRIKVKASGGIRDAETASKYIELGCERLGVNYTSTPAICGRESSAATTCDGEASAKETSGGEAFAETGDGEACVTVTCGEDASAAAAVSTPKSSEY
ncbi:deoxyribose-phosphate aldolase [Paenibacillus swuensis]|uniref:deoxyribose-phosphate aldolase n=1 Tax=Paenibacillus swuensis TaxID=1178515 RepID=UPI000837E172|nr:deoxyribose-phosphate aldolase [Paenibacillus swuensis]